MSFFTESKPKKRKANKAPVSGRPQKRLQKTSKPARPSRPARDEEISSESDDAEKPIDEITSGSDSGSEDDEAENAAEKRLRLAERYLENVRTEVEDQIGFDAADIDRDLIAERLGDDVAESKGRAYRTLADDLDIASATTVSFRQNQETVTGIATTQDANGIYAYTVSKDMYLTKYRLQSLPQNQYKSNSTKRSKNKKIAPPRTRPELLLQVRGNKKKAKDSKYQGHTDAILCVAASDDGKYIATGGRDKKLIIWSNELEVLRVFVQHRDHVLSVAFQRGSNQLYTGSKDRTIKIWNLDAMAYVETLFGHQDDVLDVAALSRETCTSVGARDRTARFWKVVEETQLIFRGGASEKKRHSNQPQAQEGSMERIAMIDEDTFVTGGDSGALSLWMTHKKKPVHTYSLSHGIDEAIATTSYSAEEEPDPAFAPSPQPRWITALATIPYTDVILTGSWDGHLRCFKVSADRKKIEYVGIVGNIGSNMTSDLTSNGMESGHDLALPILNLPILKKSEEAQAKPLVKGFINDISIAERGDRGKDGVAIVVAVGREHRLGRWIRKDGKNSATVFEVPRMKKSNGVHMNGIAGDEADDL